MLDERALVLVLDETVLVLDAPVRVREYVLDEPVLGAPISCSRSTSPYSRSNSMHN